MTTVPFVTFSAAHLVALGVTLAVALLVPLAARRYIDHAWQGRIGTGLAVVMVVHEILRIAMLVAVFDRPLIGHLPLHLCGAALILGAIMLWRRNYRLYEVAYFWALGGGLAAILTPDIPFGFPHPWFIVFFTGHSLAPLAVLYATFVYGWRPRLRSVGIALAATVAYAALIYPVNLLLGTNYLYLVHKPYQPSPIDYLGPWPWYLLGLTAITAALCLLLYLPFGLTAERSAGGSKHRHRG